MNSSNKRVACFFGILGVAFAGAAMSPKSPPTPAPEPVVKSAYQKCIDKNISELQAAVAVSTALLDGRKEPTSGDIPSAESVTPMAKKYFCTGLRQ